MKIYIGADHGGFKLKEEIKVWLSEWHFEYEDVGAMHYIIDDDYPDYAWEAASKVGTNLGSLGVLACRSGQGGCIVANKVRHVRAALAWNEKSAISAKKDDDANILCLPADYITTEEAKKIVHAFLYTPFDDKEEHYVRRLDKVKKIDLNL